jgi:hypothetical protein
VVSLFISAFVTPGFSAKLKKNPSKKKKIKELFPYIFL